MIGELEIIFSLDAIVLHLRVARQVLVFLEHLRGVAARPVVDPIGAVAAAIAAGINARSVTAATATALAIIDQNSDILVVKTASLRVGSRLLRPAV